MFLVRSAFWLTVAFIAIHPPNVDLGATANALSGQAIAASQQIVVSQLIGNTACPIVRCAPADHAAPAPLAASVDVVAVHPAVQVASNSHPAPFPRKRPDWMG